MKKLKLVLIVLVMSFGSYAQQSEGEIIGYVYASDSTTVLPFAVVWIDYNGDLLSAKANIDGKYKISAVKPGKYNIHAKLAMSGEIKMTGIDVFAESITKQNLYLSGNDTLPVIIVGGRKLISTSHINTIPLSDIQNSVNIQNPKAMISSMNSDIKLNQNNQLIIRGSRPGDVIYYIDGVKQTDLRSVPGVAINSMSVYTGGIPAKYGDTTGGVVILNTKSYFDLYYAWKVRQ